LPGDALNFVGGQCAAGGESPRAVDDDANAESPIFPVADVLDTLIFGGELLAARVNDTHIRERRAALSSRIERKIGKFFHRFLHIRDVLPTDSDSDGWSA
jgi:hypothetical protein